MYDWYFCLVFIELSRYGKFPEFFRKVSDILFFRKSYNPIPWTLDLQNLISSSLPLITSRWNSVHWAEFQDIVLTGRTPGRTHALTDGQPENIMPPPHRSATGGGIKTHNAPLDPIISTRDRNALSSFPIRRRILAASLPVLLASGLRYRANLPLFYRHQ